MVAAEIATSLARARARRSRLQRRRPGPPRPGARERHLPPRGAPRLPAAQTLALHAGAHLEDRRGLAPRTARRRARPLRDPARGERPPGARGAGRRRRRPGRRPQAGDHAARHRHHAGRQRSELPAAHPVLDRRQRRGDHAVGLAGRAPRTSRSASPTPWRSTSSPTSSTAIAFGRAGPDARPLPADAGASFTSRTSVRSNGFTTSSTSSRACARARPARLRLVGDGPERRTHRRPGRRARPRRRRRVPRRARRPAGRPARRRSLPAPQRDRELRPGRARGDGLRRPGRSPRRSAASPR